MDGLGLPTSAEMLRQPEGRDRNRPRESRSSRAVPERPATVHKLFLNNQLKQSRLVPIIPAPKITDDGVTSYVSARPISCSTDYSSANFKTNCSKQIGKNQSLSDALADYSSAKNKVF
jgi:hypothetical protein